MPVEDAADLAGFFDSDEHAVAATWRAVVVWGETVDLNVILSRPDELVALGEGPAARLPHPEILCRVADLPAGWAKDDVVTVGGETYAVADYAYDPTRTVVTAFLRK